MIRNYYKKLSIINLSARFTPVLFAALFALTLAGSWVGVASAATQAECQARGSIRAIENCIQEETAKCQQQPTADAVARCFRDFRGQDIDQGQPTPEGFGSVAVEADCKPPVGVELDKNNCGIVAFIILAINLLSALVGIIIVLMIMWGGISYITAKNDPQAVGAAKQHIYNAIIALLVYIFGFAFLQWLVPGGIF